MNSEYKTHCFIDCNSFMHYHLFTDIDWNEVTNSYSVLLILNPTVLHELDQKKFSEFDMNLRQRAQKVIKKISEILIKPDEINVIKKDLGFMTIPNEPFVDWEKEGLSSQIPDDRIIASILEQKNNFENILLVTSDVGLKVKANLKGIKCKSLPDKYLLSIKKDKKIEEIEKLRNKIAVLENKLPILKLKILDNNKPSDFVKINLNNYSALSEDEFKKKLKIIEDDLKYKSPIKNKEVNLGLLSSFMPFTTITDDEIKRYEKDLAEYIKKMSKYYKEESKYNEFQSRLIELKFVIINNGNQPAEDIDIFINFPDGFEIFSESELPEEPEEPEKPILPRTTQEIISSLPTFNLPNYDISSVIPNLNRNFSNGPNIIKKNSYEVRYDLNKIKHGIQINLDPVYILFESVGCAKSFKISYSILADNLPERSNGNLSIVIS